MNKQRGSHKKTVQEENHKQTGRGGTLERCLLGTLSKLLIAVMTAFLMITPCRAADFVIVVDVSGSMITPVSKRDDRIRIAVVQKALQQYLPALPAGSRVDLIAFSTGIVSEKEFVLKDKTDLENALEWVNGLPRGIRKDNQTYLWTTLRHALKNASRYTGEGPDQTVTVRVLTDGEDNENVTTLDNVLKEFLPVLDGEKIRSNLVLLGDLELTTKLSLPDGAFEATKNPNWEEIFPPIVLLSPSTPKVGEDVKVFENNTRSIYRDYEWTVDGKLVGREKVLTWRFTEPRHYRVVLKVTGLQGTKTSSSIQVKVNDREKLIVDFSSSVSDPEPLQEFKVMGRWNNGRAEKFAWYVNGRQIATTQDASLRFDKEGKYEVKLVVWNALGDSGSKTCLFQVRENDLTANIIGPTEAASGRAVQFASEINGPCSSIEWSFDDGRISTNRNPQHIFEFKDGEYKDFNVCLLAVSLFGRSVESVPHTVRIWAEKKFAPPRAAFRIVGNKIKAGDIVQVIDESTGLVESYHWELDGKPSGDLKNSSLHIKEPGQYKLSLTVRGPGGESSVSNSLFVSPRFVQPIATCEASKLEGASPLVVQFKARIKGDYSSLLWVFSDGSSSTNLTPQHAFNGATNYVVTLTIHPIDSAHLNVVKTLAIHVVRPWPIWAKAGLTAIPFLILGAVVAWIVRARRRKALRLLIHYWVEQAQSCQTVVLTKADEEIDLSPTAAIRVKRTGRSCVLTIRPSEGTVLLTSDGQEKEALDIGDGLLVNVRGKNGVSRLIAISIRQKPCRPIASAPETDTQAETAFCGLQLQNDCEPFPSDHDESDASWFGTETQSKN